MDGPQTQVIGVVRTRKKVGKRLHTPEPAPRCGAQLRFLLGAWCRPDALGPAVLLRAQALSRNHGRSKPVESQEELLAHCWEPQFALVGSPDTAARRRG